MDLIGNHVEKYFVLQLAQYNSGATEIPAEVSVKKKYDLIKNQSDD